jgi:hypothetical protein
MTTPPRANASCAATALPDAIRYVLLGAAGLITDDGQAGTPGFLQVGAECACEMYGLPAGLAPAVCRRAALWLPAPAATSPSTLPTPSSTAPSTSCRATRPSGRPGSWSTPPAARAPPPPDPARRDKREKKKTVMTQAISITVREGASLHGRDLSFLEAISELRGGRQITVVPVDVAAGGGDPRGEPVFGFDVTVYPARTSAGRDVPPKVNWGSTGSAPAGDAALAAESLTLASRLAMYAGLGETTPAPDAAVRPGWRATLTP